MYIVQTTESPQCYETKKPAEYFYWDGLLNYLNIAEILMKSLAETLRHVIKPLCKELPGHKPWM